MSSTERENELNILKTENANLEQEIIHILDVCEGNKDKVLIFLRIRKIIIKLLEIEEDMVTWSSHISHDLGADELDTFELSTYLEDEFDADLNIPKEMLGSIKKWPPSYKENSFGDYAPIACTVSELTNYIYNKLQSLD